MSPEPRKKALSPAVAAAIILVGVGIAFFVLPSIMIALGDISPWLAGAFGILVVLGYFALFWLRARYQRKHGE